MLAEFANESRAVPPTSSLLHGPSGPPPSVTLTEQAQQVLRSVQVLVSQADGHPLERM